MKSLRPVVLMPLLAGACSAIGCATSGIPSCLEISPPEISMTGEKTVIERQIVGDYRELEKDAWIISSVKTNSGKGKGIYEKDKVLFKAMKIRDDLRDRIRVYKKEGVVGEGNDGYLKYIGTPRYSKDKKLKGKLDAVVKQENEARKMIFVRTLTKSTGKPSEKDIAAFGVKFAEEQRAVAEKNDWIQDTSGKWERK